MLDNVGVTYLAKLNAHALTGIARRGSCRIKILHQMQDRFEFVRAECVVRIYDVPV